ncbi:TetR/AcrR family transcriptional regulator C-terminal domain-containing protein [Streptomyces sp. NPDC004629]|uniref:TetR/AcrR family transcriptional regulator C-terminal domain-containing protein n=1 Tax=Streptomyces sp. NPDC004629 TaxID=3364705 RepID=UPI0036A77930
MLPPEVLAAWQEAGPVPVGCALADAMTALADAGLIDVRGDADLAGAHFMALISHAVVQLSHYGVRPLPPQQTERLIRGGSRRSYGRTG